MARLQNIFLIVIIMLFLGSDLQALKIKVLGEDIEFVFPDLTQKVVNGQLTKKQTLKEKFQEGSEWKIEFSGKKEAMHVKVQKLSDISLGPQELAYNLDKLCLTVVSGILLQNSEIVTDQPVHFEERLKVKGASTAGAELKVTNTGDNRLLLLNDGKTTLDKLTLNGKIKLENWGQLKFLKQNTLTLKDSIFWNYFQARAIFKQRIQFTNGNPLLSSIISFAYSSKTPWIINEGVIEGDQDILLEAPFYIGEKGIIRTKRDKKVKVGNDTLSAGAPIYALMRIPNNLMEQYIKGEITPGAFGEEASSHYYQTFEGIQSQNIGEYKANRSDNGIDRVCLGDSVIIHESKNYSDSHFELSESKTGKQLSKAWLHTHFTTLYQSFMDLVEEVKGLQAAAELDALHQIVLNARLRELNFRGKFLGALTLDKKYFDGNVAAYKRYTEMTDPQERIDEMKRVLDIQAMKIHDQKEKLNDSFNEYKTSPKKDPGFAKRFDRQLRENKTEIKIKTEDPVEVQALLREFNKICEQESQSLECLKDFTLNASSIVYINSPVGLGITLPIYYCQRNADNAY